MLVRNPPPLIPDADGVYVVASSDIAKGATLTVEASSSPGNVGTVLGGVFGGGAAAASDVSGNAGETTSVKVGDKVTLKGTSNKNCSYAGEWTVKKNGESTSAATIKGNGGSATAVFSEAGTFEIEHAYCEASHFLGFGDHSVKTETFTVVVQPATPARSISISGSDTVTQFSNIQLTATVDPAEATGTYEWSSSNEDILTVDNSGNVTGVRQGTATVTVSFISAVGGSEVSASKDVTVTATKDATDQALVYYLLDPTKDANSNDSGHWGKTSLGTAMVNTTGATWAGGKNCFDNVDQRVVSWPNGTNVVPRDSDAWNEIFDNYKTTIQAQLPGVTFTKDDVEEIALVPAKISKNNGTNPDMHLDCNVSIKCKNVALVKYYLRDAGSTQFEQKGARNYISGNATQPSDVMNEQFPETKTVDGVTYAFSGWYLDRSFTQPATFPYTVNSSTSFYAKYVGGFRVAYDLAGGSWNNSDATTYIAQEGSTQTVKSEPTREGYKFTGWTIEGLPDTTALKSGETFAMPAGNVTITANWQELLSYQVKYLEKGTGAQLEKPITQYGEQGKEVSADAKTINGYHLVEGCPERITKTLGSSDNDITFWYEKDSVEYTVNYYLNGTEQKVAKSETKSAPWGTQIKASDLAKDIDGYTAVPNQDATITVDLNGNNSINVYYYQNVSLKAKSAEVTYNGNPQSVSGFEVQSASGFTGAPKGADFSGITVGANGTDAGTYPAQFAEGTVGTVDKTKKYIVVSVENGSLVINKAKATIAPKDATKAYDGTDLKASEFVTEGFVKDQGVKSATFTGSQLNVGTSKSGIDGYVLADGTNANNYDITKGTGNLEVTPVSDEVTVTITGNAATLKYDGTEQSVTGYTVACSNGLYTANDFDFTGAAVAKGTNVGTYKMGLDKGQFSNTSANFTNVTFVVENDGSLTISPREVVLTSDSAEKSYDGTALTKNEQSNVKVSGDGFAKGEGASFDITGSQTDAGSSKNTFTYTLNEGTQSANYEITQFEGDLTVNAITSPVVVTIVGDNKQATYDGEEHTAEGYTFTSDNELYTQDKVNFSGEAKAHRTDAGTTTMGLEDQFANADTTNFKNVTFKVTDGFVQVDKAQVTLKSADLNKKYDGTALKNGDNALETESGFAEGEGATYEFTGSQTVVGSSPNAFNYTLNEGTKADNYTITKSEGTLTVTNRDAKYEIEVESNSAEFTYDGNEHMAEGFKTLEFTVDGNKYTVSGLSASVAKTDAGTYSNAITGTAKVVDASDNDVSDQFSVTTKSGSLVIKQASVHMKSASGEWVYDGNEHAKHEMESVTGFAKGEGATYSYTGAITNAGTVQNTFTYTLNEGTKASNYTFDDPEYGILKVTPVSDEVTVTIKGNTATETYDGTEKAVRDYGFEASNGLYGAGDFVFTGAAVAKGTNVGTYKMGLDKGQFSNTSANFSNVTFVVEDGWLKIEGGQIDANAVTWTKQDVQKVYDGKPLSAFAARATDKHGNELNIEYSIDGETWTFDPAEISLTHFGSQKVLLRATGSNYTAGQYATSSENIAIKKRPVTLTSASANKVYDGKPLTNDTVTSTPLGVGVGFLDGEGVTCNVTGSQTNVGESDNEFTYTFNEGTSKSDYLVTYEFGKLIVTQDNTEVVVTITEHSGAFEYDGTEKTVSGYDFSASNELYKNTDFEFTGNDSVSATNVGTYDMELKSENFKNTNGNFSKVTFVVVDGQLTITPKSVDPEAGKGMSVGKLPHVTYNGESQKQKPEVKDGNTLLTEGTDYTLVYSKDTTNVGTVTVAVEGKGNYAGEAEVTYEILKRQVTLESSSASKVYDGTPLTKHEAGVTGGSMVDGESFVYEFTGTQTVAGESANSFIISAGDGTNLDNYEITKQDGTLKVEPKGIVPGEDNGMKVTKPVDKVYNGKEQKFVPVVTDGEKVLVENVDYVVTYTDALGFEDDAAAKDDFTNVTGDIFVTVTGIGNYAGSLTQSYQITPKPYTVTTVSGSKVYDGTPLEGASLEGNFVGGLVNDDDATFVVTGTQTEVGASDNTYTLEFVDERMAKNYKLVKEDIGTLTVVKDESEASQNSNGNGESKNKGALPKTGDMTLATLPFVLAVVAGAVLCAAPVARRRSKF